MEQETYTEQQVCEIVDELAKEPSVKKQRVWEVDFLRGVLILFVVWDHFMWDVNNVGGAYNTGLFRWLYELSVSYYSGALRKATHDGFVTLFIFLSGVSCSFSRSNGKRAIKMLIFSVGFTAITFVASQVVKSNITVRFNVIHVITLCVLIWTAIEFVWSKCNKNWQKNVFGATMVAVIVASLWIGAAFDTQPSTSTNAMWFWLVRHRSAEFSYFCGGDYWPFLPDFSWFLIGAFLGKFVYKQKKTLFPSVDPKWVEPVAFCRRYSVWIYFGSQVVMYGLIYLLHGILNIL